MSPFSIDAFSLALVFLTVFSLNAAGDVHRCVAAYEKTPWLWTTQVIDGKPQIIIQAVPLVDLTKSLAKSWLIAIFSVWVAKFAALAIAWWLKAHPVVHG